MNKINKLIIALLAIVLASCETNVLYDTEDGHVTDKLNTDTYQESKRSFKDDEVTYKFADEVKMFSEYQSIMIEDVREDSVLFFSNDIDASQLPQIGEIYVQNAISNRFPYGFVGRVISMTNTGNQYKVVTTFVPMDSIFSELKISKSIDVSEFKVYDAEGNVIPTTTTIVEENDSDLIFAESEEIEELGTRAYRAPRRAKGRYTIKENSWNLTFMSSPNFKSTGSISIGGYVDVNIDMFNDNVSLEASIKGELKGAAYVQAASKVGFDQTKKLVAKIPVPVPGVPIVNIPLSFYAYTTCDANIKLSAEFDIKVNPSLKLEFKNNNFSGKASIGTKNQFFNTNSKFSVSGKLGYGMGIRAFLGFGIAHWTVGQMESAYVDGKAEISANSSFDIANSSEGLPGNIAYQALSNAELKITADAGFYAERKGFLKFFGKKVNKDNSSSQYIGKPKAISFTVATLYLLPKVSAWSKDLSTNSAKITYVLNRNLLIPVSYGMSLYQSDNKIKAEYASQKYWIQPQGVTKDFTFTSLGGGSYKVYPIYKIFGIGPEIRSTENYDFSLKENGRINKLSQTSAVYTKNNSTDYIAFKYQINATIDDLSNIQEWGVYMVNSSGSNKYFPAKSNSANVPIDIEATFNVNKSDFDNIQKETYTATENIKMGVYTKSSGNYILGEAKSYPIVYKQKPSLSFTYTQFKSTKPYTEPNDYNWDTQSDFSVKYVVQGAFFVDKLVQVLWGNWVDPGKTDMSDYYIYDGEHETSYGIIYKKPGSGTTYRSIEMVCGGNVVYSDNYLQYISDGTQYSTLQIIGGSPSYSRRRASHNDASHSPDGIPIGK